MSSNRTREDVWADQCAMARPIGAALLATHARIAAETRGEAVTTEAATAQRGPPHPTPAAMAPAAMAPAAYPGAAYATEQAAYQFGASDERSRLATLLTTRASVARGSASGSVTATALDALAAELLASIDPPR